LQQSITVINEYSQPRYLKFLQVVEVLWQANEASKRTKQAIH